MNGSETSRGVHFSLVSNFDSKQRVNRQHNQTVSISEICGQLFPLPQLECPIGLKCFVRRLHRFSQIKEKEIEQHFKPTYCVSRRHNQSALISEICGQRFRSVIARSQGQSLIANTGEVHQRYSSEFNHGKLYFGLRGSNAVLSCPTLVRMFL